MQIQKKTPASSLSINQRLIAKSDAGESLQDCLEEILNYTGDKPANPPTLLTRCHERAALFMFVIARMLGHRLPLTRDRLVVCLSVFTVSSVRSREE